jgi:hypothetical protein
MKTATFEARIEAALSATLQSNLTSDQAVACVTRLLSAFKEIGQLQRPENYTSDLHFFEDVVVYN